jgi:hypothetical protein
VTENQCRAAQEGKPTIAIVSKPPDSYSLRSALWLLARLRLLPNRFELATDRDGFAYDPPVRQWWWWRWRIWANRGEQERQRRKAAVELFGDFAECNVPLERV